MSVNTTPRKKNIRGGAVIGKYERCGEHKVFYRKLQNNEGTGSEISKL